MLPSKADSMPRRAYRKIHRTLKLYISRAASLVLPDRTFNFYLDRPLTVCLPFRTLEQFRSQLSALPALKQLEQDFGTASLIFVTVADSSHSDDIVSSEVHKLGGTLMSVPDFRSLISFLAGAQFHVVLPDQPLQDSESLLTWCNAFHVNHFSTMGALAESLRARGSLKISGPLSATYAVHKSLWLNVMGNQYAFTEPLDWAVIKKLPNKFIEFRSTTAVYAHPITLLSGPRNRITRQRTVGRLYHDYLQGDSVLDIGCDVRGVEEFIGPKTRYQGIDMHGMPDIVLNLDHDRLPFEDRSIDTVVCVETLEHLQHIHEVFDRVMAVSRRYVICSLPVEAAFTENKLADSLGGAFSFLTPIAPVFDRHKWVGSVSDNLDFVYYRCERHGFSIIRIDLFYMPTRWKTDQTSAVLRSFHKGQISNLNRRVGLIIFVLERKGKSL
jgi:hypothetical protein